MENKTKKVYIGMSGGVDSSVSAYLLQQATPKNFEEFFGHSAPEGFRGYEVTGVFIKVWQPDWIECTWKEDRLDAMRVCAQLDVPFVTLDLEHEYKVGVIDYMISEYRTGRVPNPDVMCNREVKFGGFYQWAMVEGADYIATGHYTQNIYNEESKEYELRASSDNDKDQGYFLWTITQDKLKNILFPIGNIKKPEVRRIAEDARLYTATKKDSQGLCFIGKLDIKDFLKEYIDVNRGDVLDSDGNIIGHHDGAVFFTIGERHGFTITKKTENDGPLFVTSRDIDKNIITVSDISPSASHSTLSLNITNTNFISKVQNEFECTAGIRYRGGHLECRVVLGENNTATAHFEDGDNTATAGQSIVFYRGDTLLGGGVID